MVLVPHSHFTFNRRSDNILVAEHSDLAAAGYFPRNGIPACFYVQGDTCTVLYQRSPAHDVHCGSNEDVVAYVYAPAHPLPRPNVPMLHLLND